MNVYHLLRKLLGGTSYQEKLQSLVQKYGLGGDVDVNCFSLGGHYVYTLIRIIRGEDERDLSLPAQFIIEVRQLICALHRSVSFKTAPGMTGEEISCSQKAWNLHCKYSEEGG
jgi:hypothetical protein